MNKLFRFSLNIHHNSKSNNKFRSSSNFVINHKKTIMNFINILIKGEYLAQLKKRKKNSNKQEIMSNHLNKMIRKNSK